MKRLLLSMIGLLAVALLAAGQSPGEAEAFTNDPDPFNSQSHTHDWWSPVRHSRLPAGGRLIAEETITGRLVPEGQKPNGEFTYDLEIENTNDVPLTVHLLKVINPGITNLFYAVSGTIKYDDVKGAGYLEMWNYFPPVQPGLPEGQYFSRTLGETGDMQKISGGSDWRRFSLPFNRTGTTTSPSRLEINLVLPGHGTVYLRPIRLDGYGAGMTSSGWWPEAAAPWIGGIGGPVIGCCGGLLGVLAGKGKARKLVLAIWRCLFFAGIFSLIAAVIAFLSKQPYFVTMPLLIFGIVLTSVMGGILPMAKKRYDELEIRRMASMDAMRG